MTFIVLELAVIGVVLVLLCKRILFMEDGLIWLFFHVIMAGTQSKRAIATVGIEFVLKLVLLRCTNTARRDWEYIKLVVI